MSQETGVRERATIEQPGIADRIRRAGANGLDVYRNFNIVAKLSVWIILGAFALAIFAPVLAPKSPYAQNTAYIVEPPLTSIGEGGIAILGTDTIGRDVLSRIIYGARVSLMVGVGTVALAMSLGVSAGSIAAWRGGLVEVTIMRIADILFAFPNLVMAFALVAAFGSGMHIVILGFGIVFAPQYARLIRSTILSVKEEPYVEAAIVTGIDDRTVLTKHVLPNSITPVIVQASFHIAWAMLGEAALSFLGVGVQPPTASWGIIIANGRQWLPAGWWLLVFPGLAIMIVVTAFNYFGDALRDEYDPYDTVNT